MTLDEAIEQFKYDAECNRADLDLSYAEENEQVAEWLEELKDLRELKDTITSNAEVLEMQGYNKAVDDFATKICEILEEYQTGFNMVSMANVWHFSRELAEQLKVGIAND